MTWFRPVERRFLEAVRLLSYCNPFLTERLELERQALGEDFEDDSAVWSKRFELRDERANVKRLRLRVGELSEQLRRSLEQQRSIAADEVELYEDLVTYLLYYRYQRKLSELVEAAHRNEGRPRRVGFWRSFYEDYCQYLPDALPAGSRPRDPAHLFACLFQLRRAFHHIYHYVVGGSMPAARLRAAIWQSIFTHDMHRYRGVLYERMGDVTSLIIGPSGTGKELVARAIGMSRYIPFDTGTEQFGEDFLGSFFPLNLSALSPTLIESELFGHRRGSFTGAVSDREGWLEACPPLGTVFLDEIGELDAAIQVKLLRVLETRTFQRLGETSERRFRGKIIAATNRDLSLEMRTGRFREDFYYRLCSDVIQTPTLREQLADSPDELPNLLQFIARRVAGEAAESVAAEAKQWIDQRLDLAYSWPGNIRELEQCLRNVMIRKEYHPAPPPVESTQDRQTALMLATEDCSLTADQLVGRYCALMYARTGSYEQAAKLLGLDRRTVRSKIASLNPDHADK